MIAARVRFDPERRIGVVPRELFGHLLARRRGVAEEGLHDPAHPAADDHGVRTDVEELIRGLRPSVFRWPGGCTGTSYDWQDGVGPAEDRPRTIDVHFGTDIGYNFGTHEFVSWCRRMGAEPLLNWNMGTGTIRDALSWLEYCNRDGDTRWARLRRQHGVATPYGVHYWQLGNELYGWWELGQTSAGRYAETAREWAKAARHVDPSIAIVALGGALTHDLDWAWEVVPTVAPYVDLITFHAFWTKTGPGDPWYRVVAGPHQAEEYIRSLSAVIDIARRQVPNARDLRVAVTEWNTSDFGTHMAETPDRSAYQPYYSLHDALANATFLNILLRHCDRVGLATSAQALNVRGHVMANDVGVWREAIYWPLHLLATRHGAVALDAWVDVDGFSVPELRLPTLPYLDASVTIDPDSGRVVCSLVNRHRSEPCRVDVQAPGYRFGPEARIWTLHNDDPGAMNGPYEPENVRPVESRATSGASGFTHELPPHSYALVELSLG